MSIREKLGLGPKSEESRELVNDTVEVKEPSVLGALVEALERELSAEQAADPAGYAADQLEVFNLTPGAKNLMDRALDNLATSTGSGIVDEDAKLDIQLRAELIKAGGCDLGIILGALTEEAPIEDMGNVVYSMCFNVLKAAGFIANLDYRRFLDPAQDLDLISYVGGLTDENGKLVAAKGENGSDPRTAPGAFYTDNREDHSPLEGQSGHATRAEFYLESFRELYGSRVEVPEDVIPAALQDLQYFLQLTAESFGWDPQRPMPFMFIMETNGAFTGIHDPVQALDALEVKRQVSRARRREKANKVLGAAAARARAALTKASARS